MEIAVAGAGPGGLAAAVALVQAGHTVRVFERSPELRTAGAGLTVQPNAMKVLARLGLAEAVRARGVVLGAGGAALPDGTLLLGLDVDMEAHFGQPVLGAVRGALSEVLFGALPAGTVRFGAGVAAVEGTTVVLDDASRHTAELVVGADGIHSAVRTSVFGYKPLRYAGYTCWRGIGALELGSGTIERMGRGLRFGTVPMGQGRTYWFAVADAPEGGEDGQDVRAELHERFADFEADVHALIEVSDPILRNDIHDLDPLASWVRGRVVLLGDAAHATTPNMGQGACQALESAFWLACLLDPEDVEGSLAAYERRRRPRAVQVVKRSWRIGQVGQWSHPLAVWLRQWVLRLTPPRAMLGQLRWLLDIELPPLTPPQAAPPTSR